jgi:hypothetical protein
MSLLAPAQACGKKQKEKRQNLTPFYGMKQLIKTPKVVFVKNPNLTGWCEIFISISFYILTYQKEIVSTFTLSNGAMPLPFISLASGHPF